MAKYNMVATLKVTTEFNTDDHIDEIEDDEIDVDSEQDVREFINEKLGEDCTQYGDPEVEKVELTKVTDK